MSKNLAVIISPNYKDYATTYLVACLDSLKLQSYQDFTIYMVDNETTEESYTFLKNTAPEAQIIRCVKNEGFAGGNNRALEDILKNNYQYVFLVNMDTISETNCLEKLIETMNTHPEAGAIQARLMLYPKTDVINSLGNETHFLGFGYSKGYQEKFSEINNRIQEIAYPSGAAVLLRVAALKEVGLFDEEMWMYNEDQDLGWRLWLAGYQCLIAPHAVVYHKYEFSRSIQKYYWMDRNRIITILKNYYWLTLVLIIPAFIVMEGGLVLFSIQSGWFKEKLHVWKYFLSLKNWQLILKKRHQIQRTRKLPEKKILSLITGKIWYQEIGSWKLKVANPIFELYWFIVRALIV
jgi:GT2 family glycosyltransferase